MRILQVTTYDVERPDHGGKLRSHQIRRSLRKRFDVQTLSFEWSDHVDTSTLAVKLDQAHWDACGIDGTLSDWGICSFLETDEACYRQVRALIGRYEPDAVLIEQPFLWPLIERFLCDGVLGHGARVIYSSHNVEIDMKRKIYQDTYPPDVASRHVAHVDAIERGVIRACSAAIAVSASDAAYVAEICPEKPLRVYFNGHSRLVSTAEDCKWQARFASQSRNWVYVASWHPPNINGLRDLVGALATLGNRNDCALWVLGSVGNGLEATTPGFDATAYPWLHIVGPVSGEDIDSAILCSSGVVLPVWEGGGSNLKTAQALLSGKCVLGSEFSFRGFEHCMEEAGVSLTRDADGLARLVVNTIPQANYARSGNVHALEWESILESLPGFIQEVVFQDDGVV